MKKCLQPALFEQVAEPPKREKFWNRYYKTGIRGAILELNIEAAMSKIMRLFRNLNK